MEHINSIGTNVGTMHWDFNGHASYVAAQPAVNFAAWNNYGLEWTSSLLRWKLNGAYVGDGNIAGGINGTEEFGAGKPFFVIMNLAVGGSWPGNPDGSTVFPANLDFDWIHVTGTSTGGGGSTPTPTAGPTPTTAPGGGSVAGSHHISFVANVNKRVDVNGGVAANGTKVQVWDANTSAAQVWNFSTTGVAPAGNYNIAALGSFCLDVAGAGTADGTKVQLYTCNGTAAQSWNVVSVGTNQYTLQSAVAANKCLDDPNSNLTNGTQFQIWTCNNSNAQKFTLN
jgi:hypothetical protein